jgi:hypothetical protein
MLVPKTRAGDSTREQEGITNAEIDYRIRQQAPLAQVPGVIRSTTPSVMSLSM